MDLGPFGATLRSTLIAGMLTVPGGQAGAETTSAPKDPLNIKDPPAIKDRPTIAVLPVKMLDTSGEPRDQTSEHSERLAGMTARFIADLKATGTYAVVDIPAEEMAATCPDTGAACLIGLARGKGAGLLLVGVVHKSSSLIMQLFGKVSDLAADRPIFSRELNFRGDTEESWHRAGHYFIREVAEARPGS